MNETVEFSYWFSNKHGDVERQIIFQKQGEDVNAETLCETFVDFMESAGFSIENIYDYFNEE